MSALDNLNTAIKSGKVLYNSLDPLDKVVTTGTVSYTNSGATADPQASKIQTDTIVNPYGKKVFIRYVWSVDATNFNSEDTHLVFTFNYSLIPPAPPITTVMQGLQAAVSVGVSASTISFITGNGYHGNVTDNGTTITYTPTSQTFTIKYALFEIT